MAEELVRDVHVRERLPDLEVITYKGAATVRVKGAEPCTYVVAMDRATFERLRGAGLAERLLRPRQVPVVLDTGEVRVLPTRLVEHHLTGLMKKAVTIFIGEDTREYYALVGRSNKLRRLEDLPRLPARYMPEVERPAPTLEQMFRGLREEIRRLREDLERYATTLARVLRPLWLWAELGTVEERIRRGRGCPMCGARMHGYRLSWDEVDETGRPVRFYGIEWWCPRCGHREREPIGRI